MLKLTQIGEALKELLVDKDLRKKASSIVVQEAGERLSAVQQGVRAGARGLASGPQQLQSYLARRQEQYYEQRLQAALQAKRNTPVDVQLGGQLWEDAPQELRSRLWTALLEHPELVGTVSEELDVPAPEASTSSQPSATKPEQQLSQAGSNASSTCSSPSQQAKRSPAKASSLPKQHYLTSLQDGTVIFTDYEDDSNQQGEANEEAGPSGRLDNWEMVTGSNTIYGHPQSRLGSFMRQRKLQPDSKQHSLANKLLEVVVHSPWPIPTEYAEEGRYNTLLQISIGQEEVDDVITRDIHRTFPEHPQFGAAKGQQLLFKVLKAYSLHDLEVGYCQGMAFIAGILLMYVPEEPAFRLLARLMSEQAVNMRQLFLPGLAGLKQALRMFEWLLSRIMPGLRLHLEEFGVLPVLYASTWLLTAFSCPFSAAFAGRVIDIMLLEQRTHVLLRTALAVMADCEARLLELHDFEELITYLKASPVRWSDKRCRKVLNSAVQDSVSDDMITAAHAAVQQGFEGSLARRTSSIRQAGSQQAAARAVAAVNGQLPQSCKSDLASYSSENQQQAQAQNQAEMDADYTAMLLALDVLMPEGSDGLAHAQQQQQQQPAGS